MKHVFCFGETLIDFLCTNQKKEGTLVLNQFTQFPGGAPANVAVAVAKLGGKSSFIGQVGNDPFGIFLINSLEIFGVDTRCIVTHPTAKTPLAFVFLDEKGERSFSFHRQNTADILFEETQIKNDWFSEHSIIHFCSNTLTDKHIANVTSQLVNAGHKANSFISFDVNLRHNLWQSGCADVNLINNFVKRAHLVKFSREELKYLSNQDEDGYFKKCFSSGVQVILVTNGSQTISIHSESRMTEIEPPSVVAIDTTGGGDAFIGAVLFGLSQKEDPLNCCCNLDELKSIVQSAAKCGAITVTRRGAFPAFPTFQEVLDQ